MENSFKKKDHEIQILSDENLNLIKIFELIQRRIQLKLLWENANMKVKSRRLMNKSYWSMEWKDVDFKSNGLLYHFSLGKLKNINKSIIYISIKGIYKDRIINTEEAVEFHSVS